MITVQYYKYPRSLHWRHEMVPLGKDAHGAWVGGPVGTVVQRGEEPPRTMDQAFVQLIPEDRWWTAIFNSAHRIEVYVDITTRPVWTEENRVEMIDLDLDVIRLRDGTIYVDDEDEFDLHRVELEYPPRMVDSARAAAARVALELERRAAPFDDTASAWFDRLGESH